MSLQQFVVFVLLGALAYVTECNARCKSFEKPKNGYVTCDSLFHLFCSPECHPGYRFAAKPAVVYMCGPVTGEWFTYPVGHMLPWPDCIPDNSNFPDSISNELSQKRKEITKRIIDNHKGISPYISTADPEDRFHHLFDYIEKAKSAYQIRQELEKETQTLKNENHGNESLTIQGTQGQRRTNYTLEPVKMPAKIDGYHDPTQTRAQLKNNGRPIPAKLNNYQTVMQSTHAQSNNFLLPTRTQAQSNNLQPQMTTKAPVTTHGQSNNYRAPEATQTPATTHAGSDNFLLPTQMQTQSKNYRMPTEARAQPNHLVMPYSYGGQVGSKGQYNNYNFPRGGKTNNLDIPRRSQTQSNNYNGTPQQLIRNVSPRTSRESIIAKTQSSQPQFNPLPNPTVYLRKTWAPRLANWPVAQSIGGSFTATRSPSINNTENNGYTIARDSHVQSTSSAKIWTLSSLKGLQTGTYTGNHALAPTPHSLTISQSPAHHPPTLMQGASQGVNGYVQDYKPNDEQSSNLPHQVGSQIPVLRQDPVGKLTNTGSFGVTANKAVSGPVTIQSDTSNVSYKQPSSQGVIQQRKTFIPVVGHPVNTLTVVQNVPGRDMPDLNIPLYEKTFLPIIPYSRPEQYNASKRLHLTQMKRNQQTLVMRQIEKPAIENRVTQQNSVAQQNANTQQKTATQQNAITQRIPATQQMAVSQIEATKSTFTQQNAFTQQNQIKEQNAVTQLNPVVQQNLVTQRNLIKQQNSIMPERALAQHSTSFTQHNPVTYLSTVTQHGPRTKQVSVTRIPVGQQSPPTQQGPITLGGAAQRGPVTQQLSVTQSTVTQRIPLVPQSAAKQENVQKSAIDTKRTNQQGSKNILKLLNKGLNKDLGNLDKRAHLRPLRDATLDSKQFQQMNTSITKTSNLTAKIENTSINLTTPDITGNDMASHVQPIVMSGASVLNSITSLLAGKKTFTSEDLLQKRRNQSFSETLSNQNDATASLLSNETSVFSGKKLFEKWLARKSKGNNESTQRTASLNQLETHKNPNRNFTNDIPTYTNTSTINTNHDRTDSSRNQKLVAFLERKHNVTTEALQNTSLKSSVMANNSDIRNTSGRQSGLAREHLFYFPVKKKTLIDLFKESEFNKNWKERQAIGV